MDMDINMENMVRIRSRITIVQCSMYDLSVERSWCQVNRVVLFCCINLILHLTAPYAQNGAPEKMHEEHPLMW